MQIQRHQSTPVKVFIDILVGQALIHSIYHPRAERPHVIIIYRGNRQNVFTLQTTLESLLLAHGYTGLLLNEGEVRDATGKGSIMLHLLLHPDGLLYISPSSDDLIFLKHHGPSETVERTRRFLAEERVKIDAFKQGAAHYHQIGNPTMATFMLHQQVELLLRAAAYILVGKYHKTHSISKSLLYISDYIPELGEVFNPRSEADVRLLASLDKAYKAVRYSNDYRQTAIGYAELAVRAARIEHIIHQAFDSAIAAYCQQDGAGATSEQSVHAEPEAPIADATAFPMEALAVVRQALPLKSLYLVATRREDKCYDNPLIGTTANAKRTHYLLLAITEPQRGLAARASKAKDQVNNDSRLPMLIDLLCHDEASVQQALANNNRFFHQVLARCEVVFVADGSEPLQAKLTFHPVRAYEKQREVWGARYVRAKQLIDAAASQGAAGFPDVQAVLLYLALEQLLMGVIHVATGYPSAGKPLGALVALVAYFEPSVADELGPMLRELKRITQIEQHFRHGTVAMYDHLEIRRWQRRIGALLHRVGRGYR